MDMFDAIETGRIGTVKLSDEQYRNIEKVVDPEELYDMDPQPQTEVMDGSSYYITLYDMDQQVLKKCGGYMPVNKEFRDIYNTIRDNIPESVAEVRQKQVDKLRSGQ